jgi:hypothetical protein
VEYVLYWREKTAGKRWKKGERFSVSSVSNQLVVVVVVGVVQLCLHFSHLHVSVSPGCGRTKTAVPFSYLLPQGESYAQHARTTHGHTRSSTGVHMVTCCHVGRHGGGKDLTSCERRIHPPATPHAPLAISSFVSFASSHTPASPHGIHSSALFAAAHCHLARPSFAPFTTPHRAHLPQLSCPLLAVLAFGLGLGRVGNEHISRD